jgi:hypothetical protein
VVAQNVENTHGRETLLPDGRTLGQITPKQAPKNIHLPGKNGARKWPILSQSRRKEAEKSFIASYRVNSFFHRFAVFLNQ